MHTGPPPGVCPAPALCEDSSFFCLYLSAVASWSQAEVFIQPHSLLSCSFYLPLPPPSSSSSPLIILSSQPSFLCHFPAFTCPGETSRTERVLRGWPRCRWSGTEGPSEAFYPENGALCWAGHWSSSLLDVELVRCTCNYFYTQFYLQRNI